MNHFSPESSEIYGANIFKYHFNGLPFPRTSLSLSLLKAIWAEASEEMIKN